MLSVGNAQTGLSAQYIGTITPGISGVLPGLGERVEVVLANDPSVVVAVGHITSDTGAYQVGPITRETGFNSTLLTMVFVRGSVRHQLLPTIDDSRFSFPFSGASDGAVVTRKFNLVIGSSLGGANAGGGDSSDLADGTGLEIPLRFDINGDSAFTASDLVMLRQGMRKNTRNPDYDMNLDGRVNSHDVILASKKLQQKQQVIKRQNAQQATAPRRTP